MEGILEGRRLNAQIQLRTAVNRHLRALDSQRTCESANSEDVLSRNELELTSRKDLLRKSDGALGCRLSVGSEVVDETCDASSVGRATNRERKAHRY